MPTEPYLPARQHRAATRHCRAPLTSYAAYGLPSLPVSIRAADEDSFCVTEIIYNSLRVPFLSHKVLVGNKPKNNDVWLQCKLMPANAPRCPQRVMPPVCPGYHLYSVRLLTSSQSMTQSISSCPSREAFLTRINWLGFDLFAREVQKLTTCEPTEPCQPPPPLSGRACWRRRPEVATARRTVC